MPGGCDTPGPSPDRVGSGLGPAYRAPRGRVDRVAGRDDDEDWVGTPPEGRYTRDRAHPEFWWRQRPVSLAAAGIGVAIVVVIVVVLLR
jgi:hypothetical protein